MPVRAKSLIRKMRGGAQAHLIAGDDGHYYVAKFVNNPQGRRILINEWLANAFLRYLQVHVPDTVVLEIGEEFIRDNPELYLSVGTRREAVQPGLHFGSRLAVHPDRVAIFDVLPDKLLSKVENRADFLGTLVFDKWACNADSRQAVFFRAKAKSWTPLKGPAPSRVGFFAQMIDHGFAFNGPHWQFHDSPIQGLFYRLTVYEEVSGLDSFQPWLDMVQHFPVEIVDSAWKQIPSAWLDQDEDLLEQMLENLLKRRERVPDLIANVWRERRLAFPAWH